jgi:uncharacterized protein (UPF0335 family)
MIRMAKKPKLRVIGSVDTEKLESFVKRIEAVESEEDEYKTAKKDLYVEVKAAGLKPKLVRKIVKERKPKPIDEAEQAELETYREALGMASFAVRMGQLSLREAERAFGVSKSSIHRNLTVPAVSHDADGVITETQEGTPAGSYVATPSAPQLDEPRDTATQSETGEREAASQSGESQIDTVPSPPLPDPEREARSGTNNAGGDPWASVGEIPAHLRRQKAPV